MKFAQEFEDAERDHLPAPPPLTVSEADGQKFSPLFTGGQVSWAYTLYTDTLSRDMAKISMHEARTGAGVGAEEVTCND